MMEYLPTFVGWTLRNRKAGLESSLYCAPEVREIPETIELTSRDFNPNGTLPEYVTADGDGLSPSLRWVSDTANIGSWVLVVEDLDSPTRRPILHLIAFSRSSAPNCTLRGELTQRSNTFRLARNGMGMRRWFAPDPLPGHGPHRYLFQIYGMREPLTLPYFVTRRWLATELSSSGVARGSLIGGYERRYS